MNDDIQKFMDKVKTLEKNEKLDLSSDEDLSIALMNLVSIEEHLFFSGAKTGNSKYYELLREIREMRKSLLKKIIKDYEGEVWCISKHLLAGSMRLYEVGTKYLGKGQKEEAEDLFKKSYNLYSLFWGLNLKLVEVPDVKNEESEEIKVVDDKSNESKSAGSVFEKLGKIVQKAIDCCRE
jgi:hypothetical protein